MNKNYNMPCITLNRDYEITDVHPQIQQMYPELCDEEYLRSLLSGVDADSLSVLTMIDTAPLSRPGIKLAAAADDEFIRCYVIASEPFASSRHHELISYQMREPISSIFALLPVITDNINHADYDKAIMYLDNVYSRSYKLLRNVTNISTAAKIMEGDGFKTAAVDLSALLESIVTSVSTVVKQVSFTTEIEENITVNANLNLLTNGILNIIANSLDYKQDDKAEISIKLIMKGRNAVLTYADNSKGIKEQFQSLVFNPYFSKDPYDDGESDPSLGLGLFIAKAGFTHAGASLLLTSRFGEGVKYTASFPVCTDETEIFKSSATDFLLNRYSEIFVQLCDNCTLPSLK